MEEKKLRQYDFITSIILLLFGLWELTEAFKMPMKESYGGVQSTWYVSPALLPLFIGGGILFLGMILLINSVKTGGASSFIEGVKHTKSIQVSEKTKRIFTIVLGFASLIYLYIPRIDFYLSLALFLFFVCSAFYADNEVIRKKITRHYLVVCLIFIVLIATGLDAVLKGILKYNMDILILLFLVYLNILSRVIGKKLEIPSKIFRQVTLVSVFVPLALCPLFRYFLLVPLPVEGGIIKLMNLIYYTIR
ncbi:tripartite tricarboxylate transporter TctB family protein [Oceanispirochaeta crateris]|nr:tripartite tricarboxylate transporter TctB family protein [Oceanispirochaeta crateris]